MAAATGSLFKFAPGKTAVITGGASGIGLAMVKKCVGHGMNVAVLDQDHESLKRLGKEEKELLKGNKKGKVELFNMDVSKHDDWKSIKTKISDKFGGKIDFLHLNAGIGLKSTWEDVAYFENIMAVNLFGVINGISTFLPSIQASSSPESPSAIVITGSKQGITNPPGNPAYNASKAAVKSLAEHLDYDLRDEAVSVHLLVPGWTFTGLTGGGGGGKLKEKPEGAWSAEQVVDYLEMKMGEGRFCVICPDNDVTEEMDKKRMLWSAGDAVHGRLPLSRWREETKKEAEEWMAKTEV